MLCNANPRDKEREKNKNIQQQQQRRIVTKNRKMKHKDHVRNTQLD